MSDTITSLKDAVASGTAPGPALRLALSRIDDPAALRRAGRALAGLADPAGELRPVRVAVVADCTVGAFEPMLRAGLVGAGALPEIVTAPYGAFDLTLATGGFDPDCDVLSCLLDESYFLPGDLDHAEPGTAAGHLTERLEHLRGLVTAALATTHATLVLHTVPLPGNVRDSVLSRRARGELTRLWYRLNLGLLELAEASPQIEVVDLAGLLGDVAAPARDDRLHSYADLPYTDAALLVLAREVRRIAQARLGLSKKVLALDLDNTLWGGVLGEVGAEGVALGGLYPGKAYKELQRAAHRLREQGVVLVLASKNDEEPVRRALLEHPEAVLRPDDFSVLVVNWESKAANLTQATRALGLGLSSVVFMDDSPFERGAVEAQLPEVTVVDAGGDPAGLVTSLVRHGWFDVPELTGTDRKRPELYRARSLRSDFSGGFSSAEDYLKALDLKVTVEPVTRFTAPRAAQLAARTNQFNLTGVRFDEAATVAMLTDPACLVASVSVRDRFGDEGMVGAAWVARDADAWHVRNLVLSCRVLGRGVEFAVAGWLARQAREAAVPRLTGAFVPSAKNAVAAAFWEKAGFVPAGEGRFEFAPADMPDPTPSWVDVTSGSSPEEDA
ncbi:HAD-IIIC family phosphatase [Streptomyces sp. NPDC018045]|uniref:HAD-IIIC family phosphatase n=1 Tax=Streptomyces sp. NPDC018045 TaxID=3365037 RepID=UPI0037B91F31